MVHNAWGIAERINLAIWQTGTIVDGSRWQASGTSGQGSQNAEKEYLIINLCVAQLVSAVR
jgi:hypothetical protein